MALSRIGGSDTRRVTGLESQVEELTSQGEVTAREVLTRAEYAALDPKVATTEYIIVEE